MSPNQESQVAACCQNLWVAVLVRAIDDARLGLEDARYWLLHDQTRGALSYFATCDRAGVDGKKIRDLMFKELR